MIALRTMDQAEENELWQRWLDSGRTAVELRERLATRHLGLVRLMAYPIAERYRCSVEELTGAGTLGLLHAIDRYEPSRGYRFSTYATRCIRGVILTDLRGGKRQAHACLPLAIDPPDSRQDLAAAEASVDFATLISHLAPRLRELMRLRYVDGLTFKEIGQRMGGISYGRTQQLHERAIAQLRKFVNE